MIVEHVVLPVRAGLEAEFESQFARAKSIIATMPGFISLTLSRGIESPSNYLLLVEWNTLSDHTIGFRRSDRYQQWRELLHHFYDPVPDVEHFAPIDGVEVTRTGW